MPLYPCVCTVAALLDIVQGDWSTTPRVQTPPTDTGFDEIQRTLKSHLRGFLPLRHRRRGRDKADPAATIPYRNGRRRRRRRGFSRL